MADSEKNVHTSGNAADIEKEFGRKADEAADGCIVNQTGMDMDDIPAPGSFAEAADELKYLKNTLKNLKKDFDDLNSNYLKNLADSENFKKRMNRDKEESLKYANEKLLKDLLPVLDFLDMAISHSSYYLEQDNSGNLKSFVEGIKLAYAEFVKVLKNHFVESVETAGKMFDPNFHEAVEMVESYNEPEGKILEEKRKGYIYKERLLRPAMVSIAKPKGAEADRGAGETDSGT